MFDKLDFILEKYEELALKVSDPDIINNQPVWQKHVKEMGEMEPLVNKYKEYKMTKDNIAAAKEMLDDPDEEMREMAKLELSEGQDKLEQIEEELKILMLPKDPNDDKNVILEVRAGTGGDEAALFGADLLRMYMRYAERKGWKTELMEINETGIGGIKEAVMLIKGKGAYSRLKFESGAHRVQRVPETESSGRVHTSAATVAVLPEVDDVEVDLNPNDVRVDVYRASGNGGQCVNTTDSAVRLTHLPTGIVVSCQTQRSQLQNRDTCMKMLRSKLAEIKEREHLEKIEDIKGVQKEIAWGSQIRSYVFMPYTLVKDHRTGYQDSRVDSVMDGNIQGFLNAYLTARSKGTLSGDSDEDM